MTFKNVKENENWKKEIIMVILFAANHYIERGKPAQGFTSYLYRVTQALLKMGHIPIIVAGGNANTHHMKDGIEIYEVAFVDTYNDEDSYKLIKNNLKLSFMINRKIKEISRTRRLDIIQFTSLSNLAFFYYGKIPAVLRLSSYSKIAYEDNQTFTPKMIKMLTLAELLSAKRCNIVFAPSRVTANAFAKDLRRKVAVIESPFFYDVDELDDSVYNEYLLRKKYVLFFGRLYAEKGVLVMADILYDFLKTNKDYYIVFCGKDDLIKGKNAKNILRTSAKNFKDRLIFIDSLPHKKLYPIIKKSEFIILPSIMENFSNACVEAMYLKKVVIGTDGASFEQLICDGKNGLLCQINDPKSLLEKMQTAVDLDSEKKKVMEYRAYQRIKLLRPEIAVGRLVKLYEHILSGKKKI